MQLTGVLAPIPTPFDRAGRVDAVRLRRALSLWLARPLTGIVVLGTTGEASLLDDVESARVISVAREAVPMDRTFIVGTGRESTRLAIRAAKHAAKLGADAVLVRTPSVYKAQMTDDALEAHYVAVADESPVPVLLYNFPALTGVSLPSLVVARLALHENIAGMKDSSGDVLQVSDFAASTPASFSVLSGSASTFHTAVSMGATGGILALACVLPDLCVQLFELARAQQHSAARALQQRLLPMAKLVGTVYGVPGLKAVAGLAGFDAGLPRQPLMPVDEAALDELKSALVACAAEPC